MNFLEHGIFNVKVEEHLLLVDATGPFNEELIISYQKSIESCIQTLESGKWNQIIILHKLSLFTPEAERALTNTLKDRKKRGLVNCAVVTNDIDCKSVVIEQMNRCYYAANIEHQYFDSIEEAKNWLACC